MKFARILFPTAVATLAVFALAVIWRHDWLWPDYPCIAYVMGGFLSAIVVISAGLAGACD